MKRIQAGLAVLFAGALLAGCGEDNTSSDAGGHVEDVSGVWVETGQPDDPICLDIDQNDTQLSGQACVTLGCSDIVDGVISGSDVTFTWEEPSGSPDGSEHWSFTLVLNDDGSAMVGDGENTHICGDTNCNFTFQRPTDGQTCPPSN